MAAIRSRESPPKECERREGRVESVDISFHISRIVFLRAPWYSSIYLIFMKPRKLIMERLYKKEYILT